MPQAAVQLLFPLLLPLLLPVVADATAAAAVLVAAASSDAAVHSTLARDSKRCDARRKRSVFIRFKSAAQQPSFRFQESIPDVVDGGS